MPSASPQLHPEPTKGRKLRYLFHPKHHGHEKWATWCVSRQEEFGIFDVADEQDFSDSANHLYGILRTNGRLQVIGTWRQQVAIFKCDDAVDPWKDGKPWHGYPLYPLKHTLTPKHIMRQWSRLIPPDEVLKEMIRRGFLKENERIRILGGSHA